jgi:M6 family metalloprotease-like protein
MRNKLIKPFMRFGVSLWLALLALSLFGQTAFAQNFQTQALTGSKPFIIILCKFKDVSYEPRSKAFFEGLIADTTVGLDQYFREVSYNKMNLWGTIVTGWHTLPQNKSYYLSNTDNDPALELSEERITKDCTDKVANSVNFNQFSGVAIQFNADYDEHAGGEPYHFTLSGTTKDWPMIWAGWFEWGSYPGINPAVYAHEMGHAFGLMHSANQQGDIYSNAYDLMGDFWENCANDFRHDTYGCRPQHMITYHKQQLGWLPSSRVATVREDGGTFNFTLERLAQPGSNGHLLVELRDNYGSNTYLTLEARKQVGADAGLPGEGIIIHEITPSRKDGDARLITKGNPDDLNDPGARWTVGETFTYQFSSRVKVHINIVGSTSTGYTVRAHYDNFDVCPSC